MKKMSTFNRILLLALLSVVLLNEFEVCRALLPQQAQRNLGVKIHPLPMPMQVLAPQIDCKAKCDFRCSLASRFRRCLRVCNTCCQRCNCVPPGTAGNAEVCPCWNNMATSNGKKKCP